LTRTTNVLTTAAFNWHYMTTRNCDFVLFFNWLLLCFQTV